MKELLSGEESLSTAFWFVGFAYVLSAFGMAALMGLVPHPAIILVCVLITVCFFIFYEISVWRCAGNTSWIGWSWAAKSIVVSRALFYIFQVPFLVKEDQATAGIISLLGIGADLLIGAVGICIYALLKVSRGNIESPSKKVETQAVHHAERAKALFLAGQYEAALVHFDKALLQGQSDDLTKGYQAMCLKRINQKQKQRRQS